MTGSTLAAAVGDEEGVCRLPRSAASYYISHGGSDQHSFVIQERNSMLLAGSTRISKQERPKKDFKMLVA